MNFLKFSNRATILGITVSLLTANANAAPKTPIPPPTQDVSLAPTSGKATAVFAGGCFWGTQSVFERVKGVLNTAAGYAGFGDTDPNSSTAIPPTTSGGITRKNSPCNRCVASAPAITTIS